ncbi:DUF58 domain-containing protein [Microbacterium sp. dk485]|uniref:DUF58 domain-containing protein n=1 Tax=Microbacterium sp. dk485 TaxID=2560021 RepID=UPI0010742F20|nr:DUF58 domain-containing protein [Microbacterium sp. dk485]TFV80970.1 DUF58 domain-containing protein [Microbacterium sp. dk485]
MRRLWPLTARGTGAVALAVLAFLIAHEAGVGELLYFGVLLLVVVAGSIVSLFTARRTEAVSRSLVPDVAAVGRESTVRVRAGMRSALPTAPGTWEDTLSPGLTGRARGIFPALGSGLRGGDGSVELSYTVHGRARGIHPLGPLVVTATDPFGLARRRFSLGGRTRVTVAPAIVELSTLPTAPGEAGGMLQATTAQLGQGADNLVARPYAPGDSMRRIHWRATAHRDTLMVRQEEQEATPEASVVLDRGVLRWGSDAILAPGLDPAFETGVSAAVSAVMQLVREGYSVELMDSNGVPLSDPLAGGEVFDVEALAAQLATLTTRKGDDLARVAALFAGVVTGPVVVVTGRLSASDTEALAPLAHHSALPVLLGVGAASDAVDRLRMAGWCAAAIADDEGIAAAWDQAVDRGPARVH